MKQIFRDPTMPIIRYELSAQQQAAGSKFTQEQRWVIANRIEELLTERLSIEFSPSEPMKGILHDAACKGAIDALRRLLLEPSFTVPSDPTIL